MQVALYGVAIILSCIFIRMHHPKAWGVILYVTCNVLFVVISILVNDVKLLALVAIGNIILSSIGMVRR